MMIPLLLLAACQPSAPLEARAQASGAPDAAAPPAALNDEAWAEVRRHASPRPGDLGYQEVAWQNTLADAAAEARRRDQPVLMWLYFGDPRGAC
jgi:hypothetical protein